MSWVWAAYMLGTILAAVVVGPMADAGLSKGMFWICVPLAAQIVFPALRGWLPEERVPRSSKCFQRDKFHAHRGVFILAGLMGTGAIGLIIVTLVGDATAKLIYAIVSSVLLSLLAFKLLPIGLAKSNLYLFLVEVLYVQVGCRSRSSSSLAAWMPIDISVGIACRSGTGHSSSTDQTRALVVCRGADCGILH